MHSHFSLHRKYHSHLLKFDGEGGWTVDDMNTTNLQTTTTTTVVRMSLKEEKEQLQERLRTVAEDQQRYNELCIILANDE